MFVNKEKFIKALKAYLKEQGLSVDMNHPALNGKDDVIQISDSQAIMIGLKRKEKK